MRRPGGAVCPGNEADHRLLDVLFHEGRRGLLGVAADLADHHDGVGVRIFVEQPDGVHEIRADDRVAADADAGGLADAELVNWPHRFIGQRAGARDHAHVPGL
jgi:hypothetical protein